MRKYFLMYGLGFACLLTSSVFASGRANILHQPTSYAMPGWVVGADVGWGYLGTPKDNLTIPYYPNFPQSHDIGDVVWGIHGGRTFDITRNALLGFEVGYKDLGKSKYKSSGEWDPPRIVNLTRKVGQQTIDVLLTGNYFVWHGFNLFAKAGMAYVGSTTEQTFYDSNFPHEKLPYYNTKKSIWRLRPEVILGMAYMFNNHIDIHVLYDYIYGVSETKWGPYGGSDYIWQVVRSFPSKPRIYGANLVMGGISYTFTDSKLHTLHQPISIAKPGWVIGADFGWGYLDAPEDNLAFSDEAHNTYLKNLSQNHDIGDIVWGVHGSRTFSITPNMLLGFEVGYKDLARSKYTSMGDWTYFGIIPFDLSIKINQRAIDALVTGNYFIWRGLNLFAKAGMAYVISTTRQTFDATYLPPEILTHYNIKKSTWDLRPEVVLGMGYLLNKHLDVHILYDYIYGVSETKWGELGSDYWWGWWLPHPPKPRTYGANLVMGGISYTF